MACVRMCSVSKTEQVSLCGAAPNFGSRGSQGLAAELRVHSRLTSAPPLGTPGGSLAVSGVLAHMAPQKYQNIHG